MPYSPAPVIRYRPHFSSTVPPDNVIIYFEEPDFKPWEIRKSILVQHETYHRQNHKSRYLETIYRDVRLLRRLTQAFAEQVGKLTKRLWLLHILPPLIAFHLLLILTYYINPSHTPELESSSISFFSSSKQQFQTLYYLYYVILSLSFVPCVYASLSLLKSYEWHRQLKMIEKLNGELTMLEDHKASWHKPLPDTLLLKNERFYKAIYWNILEPYENWYFYGVDYDYVEMYRKAIRRDSNSDE